MTPLSDMMVQVPEGADSIHSTGRGRHCFHKTLKISNHVHSIPPADNIMNLHILVRSLTQHLQHIHSSSSSIGTTTLVGFRHAQLSLSILSKKVLQSAVASGTSNPNLEENQGFRAFQLSPQETPSFWSDASEPGSERWNYGREMAEKFCRKWRLPRHFCVLLHAVKHDMGQTALLPLRRKACSRFFRPKNPTASAVFEPANLGTKGQHATSRLPKPRSTSIITL
jgi:hypothetical protein